MFRNIRWRIAVPYVLLILLVMGGLSLYLSQEVRQAELTRLEGDLLQQARFVAVEIRPLLAENLDAEAIDALARQWAEGLGARVTVIGAEGTVLGESHEDRSQMENHLRRPEVQESLVRGQGSSIRHSVTLDTEMLYAAATVTVAGDVVGIVRVSLPLDEVNGQIGRLQGAILTAAMLTTVVAVGIAVVIAERTARPVKRLTQVARRMAAGDLDARLLVASRDEIGTLTRAFNHMGEQLRDKVTTLAEERQRLATVLELMADGVLITDGSGRVQLINPAATELLETTEEDALGRTFAQVVRHYQFIELWQRCQETREELTEAVEISQRDLFVQVVITPLQEGPESSLVILQNLTPLRRLQTVRRDFVSNISHELRTPLASLKAVVETLRDGALEDPPAAQRFLDRADREVDALTQMVQELLELSRIESGKVPLRLAPTRVLDVVLPPLERLQPQAERKGVGLAVDVPAGLPPVLADAERIRQVVSNLVHNAIKFTPAGGEIIVRAKVEDDDEVVISVKDTGAGIPATDLPRIFERFYKADRARSGGGTGLGLAIARHMVQAHDGHIWAKSKEGKGSTFYFSLPLAERQEPVADNV